MRYKLFISFLLCSFAFVVTQAREDRHICQKAFEAIENKKEIFKQGGQTGSPIRLIQTVKAGTDSRENTSLR